MSLSSSLTSVTSSSRQLAALISDSLLLPRPDPRFRSRCCSRLVDSQSRACSFRRHGSQRRSFFTSAQRRADKDHYKTLGVSPSASKAQIKSHFYQISKKHHPDVSKDPKSKEIFTAVSAAYSVLSDDRERRAYDRKLQQSHPSSSSYHHPSTHPAAAHNGEWSASRRRPGATYAWTRRSNPNPDYSRHPNDAGPSSYRAGTSSPGAGSSFSSQSYSEPPPSTSTYANDHKSMFRRRTEALHRERERVEKVSGTLRGVGVLVVLVIVLGVVAPSSGSYYSSGREASGVPRYVPRIRRDSSRTSENEMRPGRSKEKEEGVDKDKDKEEAETTESGSDSESELGEPRESSKSNEESRDSK